MEEEILERLYPDGYKRWLGKPPESINSSRFEVQGLSISMRKDIKKNNIMFYMLPPNQTEMVALLETIDGESIQYTPDEHPGILFCKTHIEQFIDFYNYGKWLPKIHTVYGEKFAFVSFLFNGLLRPFNWEPNGKTRIGETINNLDEYSMVIRMQLFGVRSNSLLEITTNQFQNFDQQIKNAGKSSGIWKTQLETGAELEIRYNFDPLLKPQYSISLVKMSTLGNILIMQHYQQVLGYQQSLKKDDFTFVETQETIRSSPWATPIPLLWARQVARVVSAIIMSLRPRVYENSESLVEFLRYPKPGIVEARKDEESTWKDNYRTFYWNIEQPSLQLKSFLVLQDKFKALAARNFLTLSEKEIKEMKNLMQQMELAKRLNINNKCDWCNNNIAKYMCSKCHVASYCSKKCFKLHKHNY